MIYQRYINSCSNHSLWQFGMNGCSNRYHGVMVTFFFSKLQKPMTIYLLRPTKISLSTEVPNEHLKIIYNETYQNNCI